MKGDLVSLQNFEISRSCFRVDEQFENDVETYKNESEKWQQEVLDLKLFIDQLRNGNQNGTDLNKLLIEKDNKIRELTTLLRKAKV